MPALYAPTTLLCKTCSSSSGLQKVSTLESLHNHPSFLNASLQLAISEPDEPPAHKESQRKLHGSPVNFIYPDSSSCAYLILGSAFLPSGMQQPLPWQTNCNWLTHTTSICTQMQLLLPVLGVSTMEDSSQQNKHLSLQVLNLVPSCRHSPNTSSSIFDTDFQRENLAHCAWSLTPKTTSLIAYYPQPSCLTD